MAFGRAMMVETPKGLVYMGEPPEGSLADQTLPTDPEVAMLKPEFRDKLNELGYAGFVELATSSRSPVNGQFWAVMTADRKKFLGFTDVIRRSGFDPEKPGSKPDPLVRPPHDLVTRIVMRECGRGMSTAIRMARAFGAFELAPDMDAMALYATVRNGNVKSHARLPGLGGVKIMDDPEEDRQHIVMINPTRFDEYLELATEQGLITPDMHPSFQRARRITAAAMATAAEIITVLPQPHAASSSAHLVM